MELSSHDFTCASSDPLSENDECNNVYNDDKKDGWFTKGDGIGAWIKIYFNENIRVSKIIYRHNILQKPAKRFNQNFKDLSLRFSDGTQLNTTLDDVYDVDLTYRLTPPKISSYLELSFISIYNHTRINTYTGEERDIDFKYNKFGFSKLAIAGNFVGGKLISLGH